MLDNKVDATSKTQTVCRALASASFALALLSVFLLNGSVASAGGTKETAHSERLASRTEIQEAQLEGKVTTPVSQPKSTGVLSGTISCASWTIADNPQPGADVASAVTTTSVADHMQPDITRGGTNFTAVAALAADDVWAVGTYALGSPSPSTLRVLLEHWDGHLWSVVPAPNAPAANWLNGITAIAPDNIWVVGYSEYYLPGGGGTRSTLIMHWDGSVWSIVPSANYSGADNLLYSVSAVSANDVWAVGYFTNPTASYPQGTLTEHWDGSLWTIESSPNPPDFNSSLHGVSVIGPADVWTVGVSSITTGTTTTSQTLTEHWDGASWRVIPSPGSGSSVDRLYSLSGVAAVSANDVWAVGDEFIEHWDGSTWTIVPQPTLPENSTNLVTYPYLKAVAAAGADNVWAVGAGPADASGQGSKTITEHWDGSTWTLVPSPSVPPDPVYKVSYDELDGVAIVPGGEVWAVGTYLLSQPMQSVQSLILHYGEPRFADVPTNDTFYPYTHCLVCHAILSGYPCGGANEPCDGLNSPYLRPASSVSRGQATKILSNAALYTDSIPSSQQTFADVPPSSPFWVYTERVYLHGAISGYPCGGAGEPCPGVYYRPGATLSRGQLAKIAATVAGYTDPAPSTPTFNDVPPLSPFYLYIERAYTHSIISGYTCGRPSEPCPGSYYRPAADVTRGQSAKIVAGAFFPDCQTSAARTGK